MTDTISRPALRSIRRYLVAGLFAIVVVFGGFLVWSLTFDLAGAVIAHGALVVETEVKKIQYPSMGVVRDLRVGEGDRVKAGDLLLRLDITQTQSELAIILADMHELMARQARDEAERDGADHVAFPAELMAEAGRPEVARLLAGEEALFDIRRRARDGEKRQLEERIAQIEDTIAGREAQVTAKHDEIALIGKELSGVRDLWAKGLVPVYRVTNLERDSTRLEGERAQLASSIAEAKGKIAETKLQMMQIDQELRSEVGKELSEIRGKLSELASRRTAAEAQLARMDIRAPQDGVVQQLNVHTIGGVVAAGEDIMKIVPDRDELVVEVRIRPDDVDQVAPGEHAVLRLSALNQRVTPELAGEVVRVSADAIQDQKTPASYYVVRLKVPQGEFKKLGDVRLVPGMPADAFIQTSSRTLMSYLMKPISDQLKRAFREK